MYKISRGGGLHFLSALSFIIIFMAAQSDESPCSILRFAWHRDVRVRLKGRELDASVCIGDKWGCDKTKKSPDGEVERSSKELRQFGAGYVIRGTFGAGLFARLIKVSPGCLEPRKSLLRSFTDYVRYFASIRT